MPRFSETEKENIRRKLLIEGERLFLAFGIKRVTIDELAGAAGIAKASFYVFYESKEYLFLDIAQRRQWEVFDRLNAVLEQNAGLADRERVRQVFVVMQEILLHHPILARIDRQTAEFIARKVTAERMEAFSKQNVDAAASMLAHGIRFRCDAETASCAFQALYHSWMFLGERCPEQRERVTGIMLEGVVGQVVEE